MTKTENEINSDIFEVKIQSWKYVLVSDPARNFIVCNEINSMLHNQRNRQRLLIGKSSSLIIEGCTNDRLLYKFLLKDYF